VLGEYRHAGDAQLAGLQRAGIAHGLAEVAQFGEQRARLLEQEVRFGHRVQPPPAAFEQGVTDLFLESRDEIAHRRLGAMQVARGLRHRTGQHHLAKGLELARIHRHRRASI